MNIENNQNQLKKFHPLIEYQLLGIRDINQCSDSQKDKYMWESSHNKLN